MAYHSEYLELISAGLDGALSPEETDRLEAHLAQCPDCKALYDQMWVTTKAVKGLPPVEPPADLTDRIMANLRADNVTPITAPGKKQPWKKWLATAAVLAVIVAGGYGMTHIRMGGAPKSANMAPRMAAPATAEAPSSAPMAQQAAPVTGGAQEDTDAYAGSGETTTDEAAPEAAEVDNLSVSATPGESFQAVTNDGSFDAIQYSLATEPGDGETGTTPADGVDAGGDNLSASLQRKALPSENGGGGASLGSAAPEIILEEEPDMSISLTVNGHTFSATLNDSPAAQALLDALSLTVNMTELNGNEKYVYLDFSLPADARAVDQIHTGDLMLFGDNCLVLFYDSFPTGYTYTPLGTLDDPAALRDALGSGDVTVTFDA